MMKLYHIVAMAKHHVIGKNNQLPWHFSSDLKHFKKLTIGSTVIMGRKTYQSIGKPLPDRTNYILSRSSSAIAGVECFASIEAAIDAVKTERCYIIGGASLYAQTLHQIDGIYLTQIDADYEGDCFYPEIPSCFKEVSRSVLQENPMLEVIEYVKGSSALF
ncbi:MAG: dihydrofolate reductase [Chlamydiota bacterium]|nr:dihydrofolate reductase [Chlamydiota bacterium]